MKLKLISMLVMLVVLSVAPMIYMGKFDPASFFKQGAFEFSRLKARAPENLTSVVTDEEVQVYKWRDKNGVMQFSNTAPGDGSLSERIELHPDRNLIQAVKVPAKQKPQQTQKMAETQSTDPRSIRGMSKVVDDARDVEQVLKKSYEDRQKILNNL